MENQHPILTSKTPYEDACKVLNIQPKTLEDFKGFYGDADAQYKLSCHRIETVIKAVKGDHEFDWNSYSERKWLPFFDMETYNDAPAGSGFSLVGVGYAFTFANVGARLHSKTEDEARAIAELLIDDYKHMIKG